jgi:hypothetical protein
VEHRGTGSAADMQLNGKPLGQNMSLNLNVGDWVNSYGSGIWQIYKILQFKGIDPTSQQEVQETRIFSKRFVLSSFKRSFKEECCSPYYVSGLDEETKKKLEIFVNENEPLYKKFLDYKPKPIDSIYNARIGMPKGKQVEEIESMISKERLFNKLELDPYLRELGFNPDELPSWTAQFKSEDHMCQAGYLVYKFNRVLKF